MHSKVHHHCDLTASYMYVTFSFSRLEHENLSISHRRTSKEGLGLQPLTRAKPLIFGQTLIFFGQKPAAKNEKKIKNIY